MLRSLLIGIVAGMRSMTPLAVVCDAARRGVLPNARGPFALLGRPLVSAGAAALAAGELFGDKLAFAPDRIILPGMAARVVTGAIAGAALARPDERVPAALVAAVAAVGAAYLTFDARRVAMRRYGQIPTGFVEDAIAVGAALWIAHEASSRRTLG